ncbi:putative lipoprotein [Marinomonas sp. MED121]|uniref:PqiC family protein n=1 Tax=Marinomonas sp. MED121 TaxID=314277 RepID=UPI000069113E|nr:ABC-type transport auxiliary lipoprotein family protein [Marinomonas sp. MED121]EAQ67254.1 putative lipoprotein [Marinomonas sp. MED121]
MTKISLFLPIILSLFLLGCNSQPTPSSHYYMLNQQQESDGVYGVSPIKDIQLNLPEYLKQPNLVLQLSEHELSYAYYHTWAESLDDAVIKSLHQDLRAMLKSQSKKTEKTNQARVNLIINIDHFYATFNSDVILAGNYTIVNSQQTKALSPEYNFTFKANIEADGYPHSVAKMRGLVKELAQDILIHYQALNTP